MKGSKKEVNQLVIVYGTLLSGYGNHNWCLKPYVDNNEAEFISNIETEPKFSMVSLGGYPGVIPKGNTSIKGELYRLKSEEAIQSLNSLEGHYGKDHPHNYYNVTEVPTEHGTALMYTLGEHYLSREIIESGNWRTK